MEDYQEFLGKLQKRGSNPHRIRHCLGSRDAWKWVRKNKWKALDGKPCGQSQYSEIINTVNQFIVKQLLEGHEVEFPHQMGTLIISSVPTRVSIKNGKVTTNYRTDWKKTLDYWFEDRTAKEGHKYIKRIQKNLYFIRYCKNKALFKNRHFYSFRANRSLVKTFGKAVEEGSVVSERLSFEH